MQIKQLQTDLKKSKLESKRAEVDKQGFTLGKDSMSQCLNDSQDAQRPKSKSP